MSELRQRLLESKAKPAGEFTLDGSGLKVFLRRWSLADLFRVQAILSDKDKPGLDRQSEILSLILCGEDNERLFGDDDPEIRSVPLGNDVGAIISAALEANALGGEKKVPPTSKS